MESPRRGSEEINNGTAYIDNLPLRQTNALEPEGRHGLNWRDRTEGASFLINGACSLIQAKGRVINLLTGKIANTFVIKMRSLPILGTLK